MNRVAERVDARLGGDNQYSDKKVVAAALLVALPLIEIDMVLTEWFESPEDPPLEHLYACLASARFDKRAPDKLSTEIARLFDGFPAAHQFILDWIAKRRSLVSHLPSPKKIDGGIEPKADTA